MAPKNHNKNFALKEFDEEKFEFPLWRLIKQRAVEKDISYVKAALEVMPEYQKTIKYTTGKSEEK